MTLTEDQRPPSRIDPTKVRVLLALKGWGQNDLARAVGISQTLLSRALSGERRLSSEDEQKVIDVLMDGAG